jgi:hypothetical protein
MNVQQQQGFFHVIFSLSATYITLGETTDNGTEKPAITLDHVGLT